jgi:hypothetical protein
MPRFGLEIPLNRFAGGRCSADFDAIGAHQIKGGRFKRSEMIAETVTNFVFLQVRDVDVDVCSTYCARTFCTSL